MLIVFALLVTMAQKLLSKQLFLPLKTPHTECAFKVIVSLTTRLSAKQ